MSRKFSSAASSAQAMQFHSNPSSSFHHPCHSSLSHRLPPPPPPPPPSHHHHLQQQQHHRRPQERDSFLENANLLERESFLGRENFLERSTFLPPKETPFVDQENGSFTCTNRHHRQFQHHHHQNPIPSGSPNFLKPTEIHQSFRQRGPSDLCFSSSSPSYPSEECRRRISSCRSSEPSFSKFSVSEGIIPAYNVSENAYVPRTPQTEDFGNASSSPYVQPASNAKFIHSAYAQPRNRDRQDFRMASVSGSDHYMSAPQKQVKLYRWYLIKCGTSSVEVAVGGLLSPGTVGSRREEMAAITKRNDKCRLMTQDGVEVRLIGLIDDCTTIANGFSIEIVHLFLSGFPYTWNHLLQNEFRTCTIRNPISLVSETGVLNGIETSELSLEGCANKEKCQPVLGNSRMDTSTPGDQKVDATAYQENNAKLPVDETLQLSASSAMDGQDLQKYGTHTAPSAHNNEELNETMWSGQMTTDELHENVPAEKTDNVLGVLREMGKAHVFKNPVIPKENVRKTTDDREKSTQKSQLSKRITRSMQRSSRHMDGNENKIMNGATNYGDASENIERTSLEARDVNASVKVITDTSIKEEAFAHKKNSMRKSGKNNVKRQQNDMNEDFVDSAQNLNSCGDKDMDMIMDTTEHLEVDEHTPQESEHAIEKLIDSSYGNTDQGKGMVKNLAQQSINIESLLDGEMNGKTHSRSKGRRLSSAEVIDSRNSSQEISAENQSCKEKQTEMIPPTKGKIQLRSGENLLSSSLGFPNSLQETETERHEEKESEMIPTLKGKAQSRSGERTSSNSEADLINSLEDENTRTGSQSHEDKEMHGSCRLGLVSLTKGKIQSISEERTSSSSEVIDFPDCLQEIGNESQSREREMHTPCKTGMIPPPLPSPAVPVSKKLISAAFGLKTSRSGRLLVPPLAHWCSQSIVRDKDGGIIAISNGSMNRGTSESGYSKFRPPAEANLQNLQKRLHEAAVEGLKKKTTNKKKKVK